MMIGRIRVTMNSSFVDFASTLVTAIAGPLQRSGDCGHAVISSGKKLATVSKDGICDGKIAPVRAFAALRLRHIAKRRCD